MLIKLLLNYIVTPFLNAFGIMGIFILYFLLFSIISVVYSIPALFLVSKKKLVVSTHSLFLPIYGYVITFVLFVFSISTQSISSFFWEFVLVSIIGFIYVYLRIFLAWHFNLFNQKLLSIICICVFLILVIAICLGMPALPD